MLKKKSNFEFIKEFVKSIHNTNNKIIDDKIENLNKLIRKTEELLLPAINDFLPAQKS